MIKYGGPPLYSLIARIINTSFEENKLLDAVGECFIVPLVKPNKPVGEFNSLRPLTLCNLMRKLLSLMTLKRIEDKVDNYTGPWQAAYKKKMELWRYCMVPSHADQSCERKRVAVSQDGH